MLWSMFETTQQLLNINQITIFIYFWSDVGNDIENTVSCSAEPDAIMLPADLQKYVEEDNEKFVAELIAWDSEQRKKQSRSTGTEAGVGKNQV